jgi:hypothetical protein
MVGWPLSPAGTRPHSMFLLGLRNAGTDRAALAVPDAVGVGGGALVGELLGIWIGLPVRPGTGPLVGTLGPGLFVATLVVGAEGGGADDAA